MPLPPDTIYAIRPLTKAATETRTLAVDFSALLPAGVTLSGTPTVSASPAGLTIGSIAVNTSALTDGDGNTIAVGEAVQFSCAGGSRGRYQLDVSCTGSDSQIYGGRCLLLVDV